MRSHPPGRSFKHETEGYLGVKLPPGRKGCSLLGTRLNIKPGDKFGRLTIVAEVERRRKKRYFLCMCDCGNERIVRLVALRAGETKSCSCQRNEQNRVANLRHGFSGTGLYSSWHCMKQRCLNPKTKNYRDYGGRGITVCAEWMEFKSFRDWALENGYQEHLTIERNDVNGNYEPDNCQWIPLSRQNNNTRRSRMLTYNGKAQNITQWSEELGFRRGVIRKRLINGWSVKEALTIPPKEGRKCNAS